MAAHNILTDYILNAEVALITVRAAFFQNSGNIMGCHRHPVLFWVLLGYFNFCENNTKDVNGSP